MADTITYAKEYELDDAYLPNHIEQDLRELIPDILFDHYFDNNEPVASKIETMSLNDILQYAKLTFDAPVIEHNKYGGLTIMTCAINILFNIDQFKTTYNIA